MGLVTYTRSFLLEQLSGDHDFSADTLKVAMFDGDAALDADTTAYSTSNEVANGNGYTTGGESMSISSGYPKMENDKASARYDDVVWTLTADTTIRYLLIYNSSQSNKAIMVIDLGAASQFNGSFTLGFPADMAPLLYLAAAFPG